MSFFGSSGPSPEEIQQASLIKPSLTENLKGAVKQLQRQHVNSENSIHSEDSANAVCNVLEAIFLHGLKASFSKKLSNLVGSVSEERNFNFWEFVGLFTHRDTVTQLNRLGQITTRVGMCRAWIRLALNDGLLESYLDAMLTDKKALLNHYRRISYLRDLEQPSIMKSYVQGISNFRFELSYNSSVLNIWSLTPLILAGLADNTQIHTPEAVIRPATAEEAFAGSYASNINAESSSSSSRLLSSVGYNDTGPSSAQTQYKTATIESGGEASGFNTGYYDPSTISQAEMEKIYQMMNEEKSIQFSTSPYSEDSFGTAASQISMPDPVDNREFPHETMSPQHNKRLVSTTGTNDGANKGISKAMIDNLIVDPDVKKKSKVKKKKHGKKKTRDKQKHDFNDTFHEKDEDSKSFASLKSEGEGSFRSLNAAVNDDYNSFNNPFHDAQDEYDIISTDSDKFGINKNSVSDTVSVNYKDNLATDNRVVNEDAIPVLNSLSNSIGKLEINTVDLNKCGSITEQENKSNHVDTVDLINKGESIMPFMEQENRSHHISVADLDSDITISGNVNNSDVNIVNKQKDAVENNLTLSGAYSIETSTETSVTDSFKSFSPARQLNLPLEPELSKAMAVANEVEIAEDAHEAHLSGIININEGDNTDKGVLSTTNLNYNTKSSKLPDGEVDSNNELLRGSQKQQSNSLSHSLMQGGWSGPFDEEEDDGNVYNYSDVEGLLPELHTTEGPGINRGTLVSEQDHVWSINTKQTTSESKDEPSLTNTTSSPSKSCQDLGESIYEEYEILEESGEITTHLEYAKVAEFREQLGQLALEKGLDIQNFQCYGCKRSVGMFFCQPRICAFNGANYCYECHENDEFYIPARIVLNWDFRKHLVCKENLVMLRQFEDSPLLNVFQINSRMYDHVKDMSDVKGLRQQLRYLKAYLFTCKQSVAEEFRQQIWPKEYLYDDVHIYSVLDLLQVPSGQLAIFLKKIIKNACQHVYSCRLCSQKGFICEICDNPKVIYPFEMDSTSKCTNCDAVYHKSCKTNLVPCPKCRRIMERQIKMGNRLTTRNTDYAYTPDHNSMTDNAGKPSRYSVMSTHSTSRRYKPEGPS